MRNVVNLGIRVIYPEGNEPMKSKSINEEPISLQSNRSRGFVWSSRKNH